MYIQVIKARVKGRKKKAAAQFCYDKLPKRTVGVIISGHPNEDLNGVMVSVNPDKEVMNELDMRYIPPQWLEIIKRYHLSPSLQKQVAHTLNITEEKA